MNLSGVRGNQTRQGAIHLLDQVSESTQGNERFPGQSADPLTEECAATICKRRTRYPGNESSAIWPEIIWDALPAGVVALDGDGIVAQANAQARKLLGTPLVGIQWRDVIAREFAPLAQGDEAVLKNGRVVSISTSPMGGEPGQVLLLMDITEKNAVKEIVNRQQRLSTLGKMSAALAHQIRTPLAACLLYASHLNCPDLPAAGYQRRAKKILSSLRHLERIVNDILIFAKGGCGGQDIVPVTPLLMEVRQVMEPQLAENHCEFEIVDETENACMRGHRGGLSGVLQNLLINSIQACSTEYSGTTDPEYPTGEGVCQRPPVIKLNARAVTDPCGVKSIEFRITDNGPGIPEGLRERVLDAFYTTKPQGTGLGLAVVRTIVHAHQGAMWIDSNPGEGTTVGIRIPAY